MTRKNLMMAIAALLCLSISTPSPAEARNAKCLIKSGNTTQFSGTCDFRGARNGSFSLTAGKSGRFVKNIVVVSVTVLSKNAADVRGLTKAGINSRWGSAKRSRQNRACWVGNGFKVCAW